MKKSSIILLISFLLLSSFLGTSNTAYAKTSFSSLIPTATMREPLTEEKDLDSCFAGLLDTVVDLIGGGGGGGGGCSLDSLARIVAQMVAGTEFQAMMNMVGQGFFGDTAFLTNPDSYYRDINKEITDNFIKGITPENIPGMLPSVLNQVKTQIIKDQNTPYQNILSQGQDFPGGEAGLAAFKNDWNDCPTNNPWDCFLSLQEPKNDPYTAQMIIKEELAKVQKEGLQQATEEVAQGSGYMTLKNCPLDNHWVDCYAKTLGSTLKDQLSTYLASSLEQIGNADELDEAIIATAGSLFDAVMSWLGDQSVLQTVNPSAATERANFAPATITTVISCGTSKNSCKGYKDGKAVTFSNPITNATGYIWNCTNDISCHIDFSLKGKCSSISDGCISGSPEYIADKNPDVHLWNCLGTDNNTSYDDAKCSLYKGTVGACGTAKNTCLNNSRADGLMLTADGSTWFWNCMGSDDTNNLDNADNQDDAFNCFSFTATSCGSSYSSCINGTASPLNDGIHWTCANIAKSMTLYCPVQ